MKRCQYLNNWVKNLFMENQEEAFESSEHVIAIEYLIFWYDRDQIALLMENFLDKKLLINYFAITSMNLGVSWEMDVKNLELILSSNSKKIKNFKPNGRAKNLMVF